MSNENEDSFIDHLKTLTELNHFEILKTLPPHFQTQRVFDTAINQNPYSIQYVPEEYKTFDLCLKASRSWNILEEKQDGTIFALLSFNKNIR